jgi:hypothetical protein
MGDVGIILGNMCRAMVRERSSLARVRTSSMFRLFGALPDQVGSSRTDGRTRNRRAEFVPGDVER